MKYQFITYIKAFCILMVIITHCQFTGAQRLHVLFPFLIGTAVPFFMIISAFNYSNSYFKNNIEDIKTMYNYKLILKRINRLFVPFIIIALLQWLFIVPMTNYSHHFSTFIINGGMGPGSYYFPVMFQIILLFPTIYLLVIKYKEKGVLYISLFNLLFELICALTHMSNSSYRLFSFRYLMILAIGVYAFQNKDKISTSVLKACFLFGIIYLSLSTYCDKNIFYPLINWKSTSMLTSFYIFPLFIWIYQYSKQKSFLNNTKINNLITNIGDASWHIFLVQATYYSLLHRPILSGEIGQLVNIFINIIICITGGLLYYYIITKLSEKISLYKNLLFTKLRQSTR